MSDIIWLIQYLFYIVICFLVAVIVGGWIGFFTGLLGGFLGIWILFMLINGNDNAYSERGR